MDLNERLIKIAKATPTTLEQIDLILEGRSVPPASNDVDLRTITLKDAALRLGVSRPTVYRLVRSGDLETVLIGGLERIRLRSLVSYATRPVRRARASV